MLIKNPVQRDSLYARDRDQKLGLHVMSFRNKVEDTQSYIYETAYNELLFDI